MITRKFSGLRWWEIALISVIASAVGGLASGLSSVKEKKVYNKKLLQAPWAPPAWVFAPAWTINNFFLLLALQRLIKSDIPQKKKLLLLQAGIWVVFFSFGYVYFNRKSPVLAAGWTMTDAGLAVASFTLAFKTDKKLAYHYLPLSAWTVFASTIAGYQLLKNPDPVFGTKALLN
ncbi:MAG: TspO/MBR family protein [Ferruginibacter sp.]